MRSVLWALVITVLLVSCEDYPSAVDVAPAAPPQADFKVGDLDEKGRLIFWSVDAFDHIEPFVLREDEYGAVLYNGGTEKNPLACYILAFQGTRKIVNTEDFQVFPRALATIPRGSVIGDWDTCSMPRSYGLPEVVIKQYEQALKDAGLQVIDTRGVCYCPNDW